MAEKRWTDADTDRLIELHSEGLTQGTIAKRLGWSTPQICRKAKKLGLAWDRAQTANATAARIEDGRMRRANLEQRLLDEAEKALDRMWEPMEVGSFAGVEGSYHRAEVDEPTPADRKAIMQTAVTATQGAAKLAEQNAGTEVDAAKSALTLMQKALEATLTDD